MSMSELCISKRIYSEYSLRQAIRAYSSFAAISFEEQADYWSLHFSNCVYDASVTVQEFENYIIGVEATSGDNHGSL